MAAPPLALFAVVGGALAAGYAGHRLARRHHVSDVVLLLCVGLVAGPVLRLVDAAVLAPAIPFVSAIALLVVLFDGGLALAWADVRAHAGRALAMTLAVWTLTALAVAGAAILLVGLPPALAALLGLSVAATGMLVVIPLLAHVGAPASARVMLTLETSLGDLLSLLAVTTLSAMMVAGASPTLGAVHLGASFVVGGAVGGLSGLAWARLLHRLGPSGHPYAFTLGALLLVYAATEALHGSGFLAALAFGLVVGNAPALARAGLPRLAGLPEAARAHQSELIFLLRTVYFVYFGLTIPRAALTPTFAMAGVGLLLAIVAARVAGVLLTTRGPGAPPRTLLVAMMPRGLATAVIAAIPLAMGVPGAGALPAYTFAVILAADLATSVGLVAYERGRAGARRAPGLESAEPASA